MMHFMRINSWHHSMAVAQGPHTSLHHVSFELRVPVMVPSMRSPDRRSGPWCRPLPAGLPVNTRSPGSSVVIWEA